MDDYNNYFGAKSNCDSDLQFPISTEMEGQHELTSNVLEDIQQQGMHPMQYPIMYPVSQQQIQETSLVQRVQPAFQLEGVNSTIGQEEDPLQTMIEEVDKFSEVMMQLAHTMYTRMTKAEYERDVAQGKISLSSAANAMNANVTQSAPQLGYGRFRDAEDESFPVPSSPSPLVPSQDGEYIKYRVHKPNVKKGTKTEARNAVKNKRPATRFGSKAAMTTPSSTMANACTFTFLQSGLTPGRIGPDSTITRSVTSLNKRYAQKLAETMVSPYAIIPSVPLTDTEVVVFFYQSVARPIVAMRLYARAWGPAHITEVLNDHRNVTYLRNTCSVKCITSINKGKKIFGPEWAVKMQEIFKEADDMKATDLIRFSDDENNSPKIVNADVRELAVGVKKMPELGKDGGIFTRCVEWCMQNDVAYTLSSVVNLAKDLQATELAAASE